LKLKLNPWKDRYVIASGLSVWQHPSFLRGMDALLIDMVEDPQKASFLFDRFTAFYGEFFRRMLREAGDLIDALPMGTELEFVIMVIAVSCVKLLSAHNSTQHTSRRHKV
jgi:hypothetical protein